MRKLPTSAVTCLLLHAAASGQAGPGGPDIRVNQHNAGHQAETSISINPLEPDNWIGIWFTWTDDGSGNEVRMSATPDGGLTWTETAFPLLAGYATTHDPVIAFTPSGVAVAVVTMRRAVGTDLAIVACRSVDGGRTWSAPTPIDKAPLADKAQIAVDFSGGRYQGRVSVAWTEFTEDLVKVSSSADDGLTWGAVVTVSDAPGPLPVADLAYGLDSELFVLWADGSSPLALLLDRSTDGGATFGPDRTIAHIRPVPEFRYGFRVPHVFSIAADTSSGPLSGNLYVAVHEWSVAQQAALLRCLTSSDLGRTWSRVTIDALPGAMPGVVVDRGCNLNVSALRLNSRRSVRGMLHRSSDGGATFQNLPVGDVLFDPSSLFFIGDYTDVDVTDHAVLPIWTDVRAGPADSDVMVDVVHAGFHASTGSISASTGGTVPFILNLGPNYGGLPYVLLGSASGTSPGHTFRNGLNLPLNVDSLLLCTIAKANSGNFQNSMGTLSPTGDAGVTVDSLGPLDPGLVGLDLYFATLVMSSQPLFATQPVTITIVP